MYQTSDSGKESCLWPVAQQRGSVWDPHNLCLVGRRAPKQPSKEVQVNNLWLRLNRKCLSYQFWSHFNFLHFDFVVEIIDTLDKKVI